jgi:hydrogenase maturation protease
MSDGRTIVAGVGNIFLGDDGFGVEVVRQFAGRPIPAGVEVVDIGIRGVHLAYELLDGCDLLVLVDASARGEPPGTVSVIEVGPDDVTAGPALIDAHGMAPDDVLGLVRRLGGRPARTLVVACEPADLGAGMDLSAPVRAAVPEAVRLIESILTDNRGARDARQADQAGTPGNHRGDGDPGDSGHPPVRGNDEDVMGEDVRAQTNA